MSRVCSICGKTYQIAIKYKKVKSAYNPVNKHRQYPNLQWFRMPDGKRVKACTKCRKRLAKTIT